MSRRFLIVVLAIVVATQMSCATMFSGSRETLHIQSEVPGTKIYVDDEYIGTQDGAISISKRRSPIIRVKKEGCADGVQPVAKQFDGLSLLGILIDFGLITILIVDWAATGAIQKFERTNFMVNPHCA